MEDAVVCSECAAEPADDLEGWDLEGEFGARCPECRVANAAVQPDAGLEGVAAAAGATKTEEEPS